MAHSVKKSEITREEKAMGIMPHHSMMARVEIKKRFEKKEQAKKEKTLLPPQVIHHVTHVPVKVQLHHQFCQDQPREREVVSTKIEHRTYHSQWLKQNRFEKVEITTTATFRHNGDGRYYVSKTEEKEKVVEIIMPTTFREITIRSCSKPWNANFAIQIDLDLKISEKDQIALHKRPTVVSWDMD